MTAAAPPTNLHRSRRKGNRAATTALSGRGRRHKDKAEREKNYRTAGMAPTVYRPGPERSNQRGYRAVLRQFLPARGIGRLDHPIDLAAPFEHPAIGIDEGISQPLLFLRGDFLCGHGHGIKTTLDACRRKTGATAPKSGPVIRNWGGLSLPLLYSRQCKPYVK